MDPDLLHRIIIEFASLVIVPLSVAFIISISKSLKLLLKRFHQVEEITKDVLLDLEQLKEMLKEQKNDTIHVKRTLIKILTSNFEVNQDEISELTEMLISHLT